MNHTLKRQNVSCNYTAGPLEKTVLPVLYSFIICSGLPANFLALLIFTRQSVKKHGIFVYLVNLSVADLINCLVLPFRIALLITGDALEENSGACMFVTAIVNLGFYSTLACRTFCIIFISISRYVMIVRYHNNKLNAFNDVTFAKYACIVSWALGILIVSIPLIYILKQMSISEFMCYSVKLYNGTQTTSILFVFISTVFFIFLMVFIVFYVFIIMHLIKVSKSSTVPQRQGHQIRTQFIIFSVIATFIVCHLPYYSYQIISSIYRIMHNECQHLEQIQRAKVVLLWLVSFNSCLDPILYYIIPQRSLSIKSNVDQQSITEKSPETKTVSYCSNFVINSNLYQKA